MPQIRLHTWKAIGPKLNSKEEAGQELITGAENQCHYYVLRIFYFNQKA